MGRGVRAAAILLIGIVLGAFRDFLFINLNYQIDHVRRATPGSFAHSRFQAWVTDWGLSDLVRLKWVLAGGFILCMWSLTLALLRSANAMSRLARPVSLIFGAVALTALLMHGLARWLPLEEASANLLHAIQYPVLLLVLQVALVLFPGVPSERT
jgi:hypothetical protein